VSECGVEFTCPFASENVCVTPELFMTFLMAHPTPWAVSISSESSDLLLSSSQEPEKKGRRNEETIFFSRMKLNFERLAEERGKRKKERKRTKKFSRKD
jgi:hypothetical protein